MAGKPVRSPFRSLLSVQEFSFISKPNQRLERYRRQAEIAVAAFVEQVTELKKV
jgi:hypothetical protein